MDIQTIIEKCKRGDCKAQYLLYEAFIDMVAVVSERYSLDEPSAKDNIQNTFIKAFSNLHQYDDQRGHFQTWLKRIAINQCLAEYKKRGKIFFTPSLAEVHQDLYQDAEFEFFDNNYVHEKIKTAIDALPLGYRTVFLLSVVDECSHKEIALQLGVSENTSRTQLYKAKKMLKNKLSKWYIHSKAI